MDEQLANRVEVLQMVKDTLETNTCDPADELIAMGEALTNIGHALSGLAIQDARRIMKAVAYLSLGED